MAAVANENVEVWVRNTRLVELFGFRGVVGSVLLFPVKSGLKDVISRVVVENVTSG